MANSIQKSNRSVLAALTKVMIVEDDVELRNALVRSVRAWGTEVLAAGTVAEAQPMLALNPQLLITDVSLPDGSAFELLEAAAKRVPTPAIVAISGQATSEDAFRLAQYGCRAYLPKPFEMEHLTRTVERVMSEAPRIESLVAASVGHTPMRELQGEVRRVMVEEALARADGSRSGAARLLSVSRQAVQQIVRERSDLLPPHARPQVAEGPPAGSVEG